LQAALGAEAVCVKSGVPPGLRADVLIHAAALVHRAASPTEHDRVNRALTEQLADVCQPRLFIFLSTLAVYGQTGAVGRPCVLNAHTPADPRTPYGRSKYAAELALGERFRGTGTTLAILRPPMVYGPGCPGNYAKLRRLAAWLPIFPDLDNARSVLHIQNLCALVRFLIAQGAGGLFLPQDPALCPTAGLFAKLAADQGRRVRLSKTLGRWVGRVPLPLVPKLFGNLTYDAGASAYFGGQYQEVEGWFL
jgi:UDP-glucose 4-epimerase